MLRVLSLSVLSAAVSFAATAANSVTFYKDVLPVLAQRCQECHRPGEIAPMSLMTYEDARPWAKSIKEAVLTKKMPPWFAEPGYQHYRNERALTQAEIDMVTHWVDSGAPEGDKKDAPPPVQFTEGWNIGKPDMIIQFPHAISIPATGVVEQQNLLVKVNFPHDVWIKAAEIRPGNTRVVHHMKAWIRPPGSSWMADAPEGELYKPTRAQFETARAVAAKSGDAPAGPIPVQDILVKYNPGVNPTEFDLDGAGKFIAAGSDIVFEIHYATDGKPETDRTSLGLVFMKDPPAKRFITTTGVNNTHFTIPAHAADFQVKGETVIQSDVKLAWIQPHMHLRAKYYQLTAYYPSGESQILLKGPFDFNWQIGYEFETPILLPKGTRLESITHFDNSENNSYNPNANIDVSYGAQTTDEMAVSFVGIILDANADPGKVFPRRGAQPVVE